MNVATTSRPGRGLDARDGRRSAYGGVEAPTSRPDPADEVRLARVAGDGLASVVGTGPAGAVADAADVSGVGVEVAVPAADESRIGHLAPPADHGTRSCQLSTTGNPLILSNDDIRKGWTARRLTAASSLYRRGDRAPITVDGYRRYELARQRSRRSARLYARPQPVDLDDVIYLLRCGETLETVAHRMRVAEDSIKTAARRRGTDYQCDRIAQASAEMEEIRRSLVAVS